MSWLFVIMLAHLNYQMDVHINFAQSRILAALVCNLQSEYGCHQESSQVETGAISHPIPKFSG